MLFSLGSLLAGVAAWVGGEYADPKYRFAFKIAGATLTVYGAWQLLSELLTKKKIGGASAAGGGSAGSVEAVTDVLIGPTAPGPYSEETLPPDMIPTKQGSGITVGKAPVSAAWIIPSQGASYARAPFSSKIDCTIELQNRSADEQTVFVEIEVQIFRQLADNTTNRTPFGTFTLGAGEIRRVSALVESGDTNSVIFETGAGDVSAVIYLNGIAAAGISFFLA